MNQNNRRFRAVDILLLVMAVIPILVGIVLKVLYTPATEGIDITGARIFFTIPMPFQDLPITESLVNAWLVILSILFLCLYFTHGIAEKPQSHRQLIAEWIIEKTEKLVKENMGSHFIGFAPFIATILAISAFSSLLSLFGLFAPTSDLNIVAGWAVLVFILITYQKCKAGPLCYLKGFAEPTPVIAPINLISEFATPFSMAFRHYGNILSGSVISVLIAAALGGLSSKILGNLPGILGEIPFFQIGLPAILSIYFDVFSGCLQAFIFAMLTMLYVSSGFPAEEYEKRKKSKEKNKKSVAHTSEQRR